MYIVFKSGPYGVHGGHSEPLCWSEASRTVVGSEELGTDAHDHAIPAS